MPLAVFHSAEEWSGQSTVYHFALAPGDAPRRPVLTIGNFDGLHLGHQQILRGLVARARETNSSAAVLTFFPHPAKILRPESAPPLLLTLEQRLAAFGELGLDAALVLRFDRALSEMSPEQFAGRFLVETTHAAEVWVGDNFRFGRRQAGDVATLREIGARRGFSVRAITPVVREGRVISSSAVREALREGRVDGARALLGRPFALEGHIRPGTGNGRRLVVPTLNLSTEQECLPKTGVYATETILWREAEKRGGAVAGDLAPASEPDEIHGASVSGKDLQDSSAARRETAGDSPVRAPHPSRTSPGARPGVGLDPAPGALPLALFGDGGNSAARVFRSVTNIGFRPTFNGAHLTIESHLLDFAEDLTGGRMQIRFYARLRDEQKFSSPSALRDQILRDISSARAFFSSEPVQETR